MAKIKTLKKLNTFAIVLKKWLCFFKKQYNFQIEATFVLKSYYINLIQFAKSLF